MTRKRKLLWQLYPSYLIIILVSIAATAWLASTGIESLYVDTVAKDLEARATLLEKLIQDRFSTKDAKALDALCKEMGPRIGSRITVIQPEGTVLGDSDKDPARMDDHSTRPEVKEALKGGLGIVQRYSFTLNKEMIYVALPVTRDGSVVGVVRTSLPVTQMDRTLRTIHLQMVAGCLIIAVLAALMCLYVSHRINRPISGMTRGALRFSGGDLQYRLEVPNTQEFASLAQALNSMAAQLHARITEITRQRNELEAMLSGMIESVLVIDRDERVVRANKAAQELFALDSKRIEGKGIREVVRNTELHRFVERTLSGDEPIQGDIVFFGEPERFIQANGVPLSDPDGKGTGALVVLNDVTRLKALENIRRDFVTNVSHELRTPVTSIKGFLETLKDGAVDDAENRERFLDIIIKHTDRLSAIIEDLLSLSRIEQDSERGTIQLEHAPIADVFDAVEKMCREKAEEKEVEITFESEPGLKAHINRTLLEEALFNLVDNAIKYSGRGSTVKVRGEQTEDAVVLRVKDQGTGIPKEHLTRIFERFYRVDKARSSSEGGTGLGLAIAKHIVNAHHGRIEVHSSPGEGSTFSIHLPPDKE